MKPQSIKILTGPFMKSQDEQKEQDQINIRLSEMSDIIKSIYDENKALRSELTKISNQQSQHIEYIKEQFSQLNSTIDKIYSMSQPQQQQIEENKKQIKYPSKTDLIDTFDQNQYSNKKEQQYEEVSYSKEQVLQLLDHMQYHEDNKNKRSIVSEFYDLRELIIEYVPKRYQNDFELQKQLEELLKGYQNVRGDGNCFYTAFMFSLLQLLKMDQQLKNKFLNKITQVRPIQLKVNSQLVPISMIQFLLKEFVQYVSILKCRDIYNDFLQKYVQIQSVVFLRCLLLNQWENYKEFSSEYDQSINQLSDWGIECNENELAIKILNEYLEMTILLFYFQPDRIKTNLYGIEQKQFISLIYRQGHYCIAIPNKGVDIDKFDQFQLVYEDLSLNKSISLSKQNSQDPPQSDILSSKKIENNNLFIQPKEELDNYIQQNSTCQYQFQVKQGSYNFIIAFCFQYLLVKYQIKTEYKNTNQISNPKEFDKVYNNIIENACLSMITYQQFENFLMDQFNNSQHNVFRENIRKSYFKKLGQPYTLSGKLNYEEPGKRQEFEKIAEIMQVKLIIYEYDKQKLVKREYGENKHPEIKLLWIEKQKFNAIS